MKLVHLVGFIIKKKGKKVVTVHTMHTYGGAEVLVHSLTLALDVETWSASCRIRNHL